MIKTETRPCVDCNDDTIAPEPEALGWEGDWLCYWCHCKRENFDVKERLNHFAEMFKTEQLIPREKFEELRTLYNKLASDTAPDPSDYCAVCGKTFKTCTCAAEECEHLKARVANLKRAIGFLCKDSIGTAESRAWARKYERTDEHIVHEWKLKTDSEYSQERKDAYVATITKTLEDIQ